MADTKTLLLIDSFALIYRAYYAFPPNLTTEDGIPINAVYGFASLLLDVLLKFKPTHVVALMDSASPTIRSNDYTQYKANRKEAEDDFLIQIPKVEELLNTFDIPILSVAGYEADDVIATIDHKYSGKWAQTIIVTGDRDLFQLVDEDTFVYLAGSSFSQSKLYNAEMVKEKMGVTPEQITDFKGLSGDASDNIPGVAGIGDKSAVDLISQYGTIEEIYKNIEKVIPRYQNKLKENYETAILSKNLATVMKEVPIVFNFDQANFPTFNGDALEEIFKRLRFKSLEAKLGSLFKQYKVEKEAEPTLFNIPLELKKWDYSLDLKNEDIFILFDFAESKNCFDIKLNEGYISFKNQIYSLEKLDLDKLANLINKNNIYAFDLKKILHAFLNHGLNLDINRINDLGIQSLLYAKGMVNYSLKNILTFFEFKHDSTNYSLISGLVGLKGKMDNEFKSQELYNLEKATLNIVVNMERSGIVLDTKQQELDLKQIQNGVIEVKNFIFKEVGHEFNINSPKQLGEVLFNERGLKSAKKTKGGSLSTNEASLNKMIDLDPLIPLILKYRELEKVRSTYLETFPSYIYEKTGRLHATFDQFGSVSGRFSAKNPNMQNIPKGLVDGINIRDLFVSDKDKYFVGVDYSQQELRILAALANDETMLEAFNSDMDIHKITASELFNIEIDSVSKEQRNIGKTINFSVIYGISPFALSERLKIERNIAFEFIEKYYKKYPKIKEFMNKTLDFARENKYTETVMGRRREELNINSTNKVLKSAAERELFNFVIQGSAADLMKMCMVKFDNVLKDFYAELILQVHDEFLFELPLKSNKDDFIKEIKNIMLNIKDIGVKYDVDVKYGQRWGSMSEY